jgi:hypothetical protein
MSRELRCFLSLLMSFLLSLPLLAQYNNWGSFDRLTVTRRFLEAMYPGLRLSSGLLLLRDAGAMSEIDAIPCRLGTGVDAGYVPGAPPAPPPPPHCIGLYPSGPSDFLSAEVRWSTKYPIRHISVGGSFVRSRAELVLKEIADHPDWSQEQRLEALHRAGPRFGSGNRGGLLRIIPVDVILKFTGCRLQPGTAALFVWRDEAPPDPPVAGVAWRISGKYIYGPELHNSCSAEFEPFDGKLLGVTDLAPG